MRFLAAVIVTLTALLLASCSSPQCSKESDCTNLQMCLNGTCVEDNTSGPNPCANGRCDGGRPNPPPPPPPPGTDASNLEGGVMEAGVPMGDGGMPDSGMHRPVMGKAFAWVGTLQTRTTGTTQTIAYAEVVDLAGAGVNMYEERPIMNNGSTCTLKITNVLGTQGIGADAIVVTNGRAGEEIRMLPNGTSGRFAPPMLPPEAFFQFSPPMDFEIQSGGEWNLRNYRKSGLITRVRPLVSLPVFENVITISSGPITFSWNAQGDQGNATIELYDVTREHILECITPSSGSYILGNAALAAFTLQNPVNPWTLELRHDTIEQADVEIESTSVPVMTVPMTFKVSYGARFNIAL